MPVSTELAERLLKGMEHNRVFLAGNMKLNKAALAVYDRDLEELRHAVWEDRNRHVQPVQAEPLQNIPAPEELNVDPDIIITHVQTKNIKRRSLFDRLFGRLGNLMS